MGTVSSSFLVLSVHLLLAIRIASFFLSAWSRSVLKQRFFGFIGMEPINSLSPWYASVQPKLRSSMVGFCRFTMVESAVRIDMRRRMDRCAIADDYFVCINAMLSVQCDQCDCRRRRYIRHGGIIISSNISPCYLLVVTTRLSV